MCVIAGELVNTWVEVGLLGGTLLGPFSGLLGELNERALYATDPGGRKEVSGEVVRAGCEG